MAGHHRLDVSKSGDVTIVRFVENRILDATYIEELGDELFGLVEKENCNRLVLNFAGVEFLSSAALNKLIILDKKVKGAGGKLVLCEMRPEISEIFSITRLDQLFQIAATEADAVASC